MPSLPNPGELGNLLVGRDPLTGLKVDHEYITRWERRRVVSLGEMNITRRIYFIGASPPKECERIRLLG